MLNLLPRRCVEAIQPHDDVLLVQLIELTQVATDGQALSILHEAVQRGCTLAACRDRVDCKLRAGIAVAADEDVPLRRLIGNRVRQGVALFADFQRADVQRAPIDLLSDRGNDGIDLDGFEFARSDRRSSAALVRLSQLHDLNLQARDRALLIADNFNRCVQIAELHALCHRLGDLFRVGRHFSLAAAVDNVGVLRAETARCAAHVHCNVAAADDRALLADLWLLAKVHFAQEVHTAEHALQLLAGNMQRLRFLCADSNIKALVALLTELLDGDVLADFRVHLKVYAHLAQHIDFGFDDLLFQAEAGNAHGKHTARLLVAVEDRDVLIAHIGEIVRAAQTSGACADDGDLLQIRDIHRAVIETLRDVTVLLVQLLLSDELFDLVDRNGAVNAAARAGVLAAAVADKAADGRERVILLDELQRIEITPLSGHLDVALHGDVRGARRLARRRAGLMAVFLVVDFIIFVPHVLAPVVFVGQGLLGIFDRAVLRTELLAKLGGAGGTYLHALAAGHALLRLDMRTVGRRRHVRRVEQLARAQGEAHTDLAVAQTEDLILTVDVRDLVDVAVVLRTLDNLQRFLLGDRAALAGLDQIF